MGLKEDYAAMVAEYSAAVKANDYDKVGAMYTEDGSLCWFMTPIAKGRAAVIAAIKSSGGEVDADAFEWKPFNDDYTELGNGLVLARGEYKMKMGGKEGGFWFTSLCKRVDGKLRIVADASAPCCQ